MISGFICCSCLLWWCLLVPNMGCIIKVMWNCFNLYLAVTTQGLLKYHFNINKLNVHRCTNHIPYLHHNQPFQKKKTPPTHTFNRYPPQCFPSPRERAFGYTFYINLCIFSFYIHIIECLLITSDTRNRELNKACETHILFSICKMDNGQLGVGYM
jgi:hypothetical protein